MLTVALGHRDDLGRDGHELSARVLLSPAASRANPQRDLVTRSALVRRSAEDVTSHREQRRVVIESVPALTPEPGDGFTEERERLRLHLEAQHVALHRGRAHRVGPVSRALARHELLELPHGLALGELEPLLLGVGHCDARQLAHGGPAERAGFQRARQARQLFERLGDAQLLLERAARVAQQALDVLTETAKAEVHVRGRASRDEQPAPFFSVGLRALPREP